ncbi:hypothetical protein RJ640_016671 [Escallonia rubra]|uniref:GAG-pre-integrase domain-containing protein n=1 Tax=Escallonia rubra TaxID=112253 RepID=A0AA88SLY1_9ASTE|nr:hypothetical protein RJ640_016671 [Escallonia rubra]
MNKSASSNGRDFKEKKFKPRKALLTWDDSDESDKETSEDDDVAQLCFMANDDHSDKVCLKVNVDSNKWILNIGCSRHMIDDRSLFSHITLKNRGLVTFGDNSNEKIIGKGKIGIGSISIDNVSLVDELKFNLISISQLIDSGHKVQFEVDHYLISHASDGGTLVGKRHGNIYTLSFDTFDSSREVCLSAQQNDIWLWHHRLGHVHMDLIKKLLSKELVRGLSKLKFVKDKVCDACQYGKQEFEMSMMGELTFFLGLQIKQSKEGIFISQSKYTRELLKRFGMDNAKPRGTPISPSVNLVKDENGKDVDNKLYRGMIGSLLYLTASRPDISTVRNRHLWHSPQQRRNILRLEAVVLKLCGCVKLYGILVFP